MNNSTIFEAPMSYGQQRLWFLQSLYPEMSAYNIPFVLHWKGTVNVEAMRQSLDLMIQKYEIFRTQFRQEGAKYKQIIYPYDVAVLNFEYIESTTNDRQLNYEKAIERIHENKSYVYTLATEYPYRFGLFQISDNEYLFYANIHHIIFDRSSFNPFIEELMENYQRITENKDFIYEPATLQYADYSFWQQEQLEEGNFVEQQKYWIQKLADAPVLILPTDRNRTAIPTFNGGKYTFTLTKELTKSIKDWSHTQRLTLNMALLSAYKVLLFQYTDQTDLLVGTPIAGRNQQEMEKMIGFFVNTLVVRTTLDLDQSFSNYAQQVKQQCIEAYTNQDVPFDKLVEILNPERSVSISPIFQVLFSLQNSLPQQCMYNQIQSEMIEIDQSEAKCDLALLMTDDVEALRGEWHYNADLWEEATIERMNTHFRIILQWIIDSSERLMNELDIRTVEEKQLMHRINQTKSNYINLPIQELFEQQARRNPEAIAIIEADKQLSYGEVDRLASILAHTLQVQGISAGDTVGICIGRSCAYIISALAVLKIGGIYVPIDTNIPDSRIGYILQDSRVNHVIIDQYVPAVFAVYNIGVIDWNLCLPDDESTSQPIQPHQIAEEVAYIIYTSGSTGQPKGVAIRHQGVARLVQNTNYIDIRPQDYMAQIMNVSFDISAFEIWGALLNGATLVIAAQDTILSPVELKHWIHKFHITIMAIPAALFGLSAQEQPDAFSTLHTLLIGGEVLSPKWVESILKAGAPCRLLNSYGPSENTAITLNFEIHSDTVDKYHSIPIGTPVSNTQVYVLNQYQQPVPIGVPGELYLGGDGIAAGYWNRDELTTSKFVSVPSVHNERLYRTGDMVQFHSDGQLHFIGRTDHQIKLRGYRIELGEIEEALRSYIGITEAVVHVVEINKNGQADSERILVAYYSIDQHTGVEKGELRQFLREQLPDYMIPSAWIEVGKFQWTSNGKIDREQLPTVQSQDYTLYDYVEPQHPIAIGIAQIWSALLDISKVGLKDHFFAIGGHSLLATQVLTRIEADLGKKVSLRMLFEYPVLEDLATCISELPDELNTALSIPRYRSRDGRYPLSSAQQRLWFLNQLESDNRAYHIPFAFQLEGELNTSVLEQAIQYVIQDHDSLRTVFGEENGTPYQQIDSNPIHIQKMTVHPSVPSLLDRTTKVPLEIEALLAQEAWEAFDLMEGPLLRVRIIELSPTYHILSWVMHHIIFDGWSEKVLREQVNKTYIELLEQTSTSSKEVGEKSQDLQYIDYAHWQHLPQQQQQIEQQLDYWKEQLQGELPILELPTDHPRPRIVSSQGKSQHRQLSVELIESLREWSQSHEVTLPMTLLATFKILLHRYTGQSDLLVGMPVSGRTKQEWTNLIGFFVNTIVIRTDLSKNPSFEDYVKQVREQCLNAYAHQDIPFEKVVEAIQPERELSHTPIFQVMFSSHFESEQTMILGEHITVTPVEIENVVSKFDLSTHIQESGDMIQIELQYNSNLFDDITMATLMEHWIQLLHEVMNNPQSTVFDISLPVQLFDPQIVLNQTLHEQIVPDTLFFYDYIDQQANLSPEKIALQFEESTMTYQQLVIYSNQIAHYIQHQGYAVQSTIGVYMEKDLSVIPIVLGIMKAGCIFVPLDPQHPIQRTRYLMEDVNLQALFVKGNLQPEDVKDIPVIHIEHIAKELNSMPASYLNIERQSEQGAYIIYTSGTTGRPKGVMINHLNLAYACPSWKDAYHTSELERFVQLAGISFDVFIQDMIRSLCSGGTLILCSKEILVDSEQLYNLLSKNKVEFGEFVPAVLKQLANYLQIHDKQLPDLKRIVSGADTWYVNDFQEIQNLFHEGITFINSYGVTEVTIDNIYFTLTKDTLLETEIVPIGHPFPHIRVYLLDDHQQPVPRGVAGEIYIGGPAVSSGYYQQPELTAQKFVKIDHIEEGILYRTGDLAKYSVQGHLQFIGRKDNQIKIRGYRIETGEIESSIRQTGLVQDALVTLKEVNHNQQLVAYLIKKQDIALNEVLEQTMKHLREQLPAYMIPVHMIVIDHFPLNDNGKIDLKGLPIPIEVLENNAYIAPKTDFEYVVAEIWKEVLQIERVGVKDHFFELGGHSLIATQVTSRLQNQFQISIPLKTIFELPVLEQLAAYVEHELVTKLELMSEEEVANLLAH